MSILIIILTVIAGLIALLLISALFISKEYSVQGEITINKPKQQVFNYVKMIKNQDQYSKWVMADPASARDFRGTDGTVGFVYTWDGKKAGKGEQEIRKIADGDRIEMEIRFAKPFEAVANTYMITASVSGDTTKVTWGMNGKSNYPVNLMTAVMSGVLRKDIATSLVNLKAALETK
jgi:uncharacterized protein YndB with AHSA1/START domain